MDATQLNPTQEIIFLKGKYNQLVDLTSAIKNENEHLKKINHNLSEDNKNLSEQLAACYDKLQSYPVGISGTLVSFFADFNEIIKKALEQEAFIPYSYSSKNAKEYMKIEKNIFESLIIDTSAIPLKTFKEYCAQFMLIKSENNKVTYTSDKLQVYYINKAVLNCIKADLEAETAAPENA